MFGDVLYCRLHFEMMTSSSYGPGPGDPIDMCPPLHSPGGKMDEINIKDTNSNKISLGDLYPPGMGGPGPHPSMFVPGPGHPPGFPGGPDHWPYGPGPDFGPIPDYQFNNNNDPIKKRRGRKKRKVDEFAAMNGYMEVKWGIFHFSLRPAFLSFQIQNFHVISVFRVIHPEWKVTGWARPRPSGPEPRSNTTS